MGASSGQVDVSVAQVGGHPAVDLLNTVDWRLDPDRRHEQLVGYEHVLVWARTVGLLSAEEAEQVAAMATVDRERAAAEHRRILAIREDLYDALTERRPVRNAVRAYRESLGRATIAPGDDGWQWRDDAITLTTPRDRIARAVIDLFGHPKLSRFHRCEGEGCGWVYLDTSPRGDRRWCTTAGCGNRDRARRHYRRTRGDGSRR